MGCEPHPVVFEPPAQGGEGPGVGQSGLPAEGPRRLAGSRGAHHGEAAPLEGVPDSGMTVVLPDPATPSTSSTLRPEVVIPSTAASWPGVSGDPRSALWRSIAPAATSGETWPLPVLDASLHCLFDASSVAMTWAVP